MVSEAGDGESCLRQLEVYKPDVLLLDINMPKMNGLEVLHKIREKKNKCENNCFNRTLRSGISFEGNRYWSKWLHA